MQDIGNRIQFRPKSSLTQTRKGWCQHAPGIEIPSWVAGRHQHSAPWRRAQHCIILGQTTAVCENMVPWPRNKKHQASAGNVTSYSNIASTTANWAAAWPIHAMKEQGEKNLHLARGQPHISAATVVCVCTSPKSVVHRIRLVTPLTQPWPFLPIFSNLSGEESSSELQPHQGLLGHRQRPKTTPSGNKINPGKSSKLRSMSNSRSDNVFPTPSQTKFHFSKVTPQQRKQTMLICDPASRANAKTNGS